jgi:hypothetical protein
MIRFLCAFALASLLSVGSAQAQSSYLARPYSRVTIALVQGTLGGAVDTGVVDVKACRLVWYSVNNTGTVASAAGSVTYRIAGEDWGPAANAVPAVAPAAGSVSFFTPTGGAYGMVEAIRVTFAATANATVRLMVHCLR